MNSSNAMLPTIHAATAMFPGFSPREAIRRISEGVTEPLFGDVSTAEIQLCPQNPGWLSDKACEELAAEFQNTRFRLHANAPVQKRHRMLDASTFSTDTHDYYRDLAERSRRLGARAYSLHAGYAENCDLPTMIDNIHRLQDLFGPDCTVAVEGLYPNSHRPQLMDSWQAYEAVMRSGIAMAIDCSHLNIVARKQRTCDTTLLNELVTAPNTVEVHISDNNGANDAHAVLEQAPWWWEAIKQVQPHTVVFTEANQVRYANRQAHAPSRQSA